MPDEAKVLNPADAPVIGYIGLGEMGGPMARRLAALGFRVRVYDISERAVQAVVQCGAIAAASPREIASRARIVFTCLPSLPALRAVALGAEGLLHGDAIAVLVDLSTTGSQFARELSEVLADRGIAMLSSPITGNVRTAADGTLGIMCSGPPAAFREAEPVMKVLAGTLILYLGEQPGVAQTLKLLNNLLSATGMAASAEAFILGVKAGLDPHAMLEVINAGEASSSASRNKFARCILPRQFDFGARMAITIKDITTTLKEADDLGVPLWVAPAVRELWAYAISQGASDRDGTALITYLEPWAGVEVRAAAPGSRQRPPPAAGLKAKPLTGALVVLCAPRMRRAVALRLRAMGWAITTRLRKTSAGAPHKRLHRPQCILLSQPAQGALETFVESLDGLTHRRLMRSVVNLCAISSGASRVISRGLSRRGIAWLDAPLTGTPEQAREGQLTAIASGPRDAFVGARSMLDALAGKVFYMGARPGAAQIMHQINGALFSILFAATCESFATGSKAGLSPETMTKIMGIETGRNAASAIVMPQQVATRRFHHGKRIEDACSELLLLSEEARKRGVTMWVAEKARLLYGLAAALGSPHDDITRLITHYEKWARTQVRLAETR